MASASPGGVRFNAESSESALLSALRVGDRLAYREAMRRFGGSMLAAARAVAPAPRITTWPLIAILWELSD